MVTGDFNTIDHHEVNHFVGQMLGRNAGLLVTLGDALIRAYAGGELADQLLVNALATVAPEPASAVCHAASNLAIAAR